MFHRISWLAAIVLVGTIQPADAGVIERDWKNAGDGLLTYDDSNDREWLDLTETLDMPLEVLVPQLEVRGEYAGFSLASVAEVRGLAESAGIITTEFTVENVDAVRRLQTQVGVTCDGCFLLVSSIGMARLDDSDSLTRVFIERSSNWPDQQDMGRFLAGMEVETPDQPDRFTGYWLYRVVPEPSNSILLLTAISFLFLRYGRNNWLNH